MRADPAVVWHDAADTPVLLIPDVCWGSRGPIVPVLILAIDPPDLT